MSRRSCISDVQVGKASLSGIEQDGSEINGQRNIFSFRCDLLGWSYSFRGHVSNGGYYKDKRVCA